MTDMDELEGMGVIPELAGDMIVLKGLERLAPAARQHVISLVVANREVLLSQLRTRNRWPHIATLRDDFYAVAWPAEDGGGLVLHHAGNMFLSERMAGLEYAALHLNELLHELCLEHLPRRVWLAGYPSTAREVSVQGEK